MSSMDRRAFIANGTLLTLAAYVGCARAQDVPRSSFPLGATAEDVTAGIDLSGKTVVVTGCNSGIGLETMRVLALRGAHVIGTARTAERGREACASVQGKTTPEVLELSDFDSVVACANAIRALDGPIDVLVCNAGVLLTDLQQVRGLEMQFVVNHLGHFILANRLARASDRGAAGPRRRGRQHRAPRRAAGRHSVRQLVGQGLGAAGVRSLEARERPVLARAVEAPRRHARDVELAASRASLRRTSCAT